MSATASSKLSLGDKPDKFIRNGRKSGFGNASIVSSTAEAPVYGHPLNREEKGAIHMCVPNLKFKYGRCAFEE